MQFYKIFCFYRLPLKLRNPLSTTSGLSLLCLKCLDMTGNSLVPLFLQIWSGIWLWSVFIWTKRCSKHCHIVTFTYRQIIHPSRRQFQRALPLSNPGWAYNPNLELVFCCHSLISCPLNLPSLGMTSWPGGLAWPGDIPGVDSIPCPRCVQRRAAGLAIRARSICCCRGCFLHNGRKWARSACRSTHLYMLSH